MPYPLSASVILTATLLLTTPASALMPITPVTLRELTQTADLIAIVKVERIEVRFPDQDSSHAQAGNAADKDAVPTKPKVATLGYKETVAVLRIQQGLRSDVPDGEEICVPFPAGMACPAPPRYVKGETTLVFLKKNEEGIWKTCSLSYGTIAIPDAKYREAYVTAIRELFRIAQVKDEADRKKQTVEWLVRGIENKHTRSEAAFDMQRDSSPLELYFADPANGANDVYEQGQCSAAKPQNLLALTTPEQKERLRKVLKELKPDDEGQYDLQEIVDRFDGRKRR